LVLAEGFVLAEGLVLAEGFVLAEGLVLSESGQTVVPRPNDSSLLGEL
jgi:hypothetical protein